MPRNTIDCHARSRRVSVGVAVLAGTIPWAAATAQTATIIELGEPNPTSSVSTSGIGDAQLATGQSNGGMYIFRAGQTLSVTLPGGRVGPVPSDMSPAGLIVGSFFDGSARHAFTLDADSLAFATLADMTLGETTDTLALALSDNERFVLGEARNFNDGTTGHVRRPVLWTDGGGPTDIGDNGLVFTLISDINNDGDVVGTARVLGSPVEWHGYARIGGTWMDIGGLGGNRTDARAINNLGVVTGNTRDASNNNQAFVWSIATQQVEALPLPLGFTSALGYDINDAGTVVGWSRFGSNDTRATYWPVGATRGIDLNSYLPSNSGWQILNNIAKIDSCGVVIGQGIRQDRPGYYSGFMMVLPEYDLDGDGLADCWERNGIDLNGDGLVDLDLPAMGADPMRKDLFVEIDAMAGRAPSTATIARVTTAFANAPVANPDGSTGITLHPIIDETNLTLADFPNNFAEFDPLKKLHFASPADRAAANADQIIKARRLVFRYCIFANTYNGGSSSGLAEVGGNDLMVTLGGWTPVGGTPDEQAGTFMHEFGHTLNLNHGGGDATQYKPNYYSVMSYMWQTPDPAYASSWQLDYSRTALPDLDEAHLDETVGLGAPAGTLPNIRFPFRAKDGTLQLAQSSGPEPIDWEHNGSAAATDIQADLNHLYLSDPATPGQTITGHDDWANLVYNFRLASSFADGVHQTTDELTFEQAQAVRDELAGGTSCPIDLTASADPSDPGFGTPDGVPDANDFFYFLDRFAAGDLAVADLTGSSDPSDPGFGVPDGVLDADDFVFFLDLFASGCP